MTDTVYLDPPEPGSGHLSSHHFATGVAINWSPRSAPTGTLRRSGTSPTGWDFVVEAAPGTPPPSPLDQVCYVADDGRRVHARLVHRAAGRPDVHAPACVCHECEAHRAPVPGLADAVTFQSACALAGLATGVVLAWLHGGTGAVLAMFGA